MWSGLSCPHHINSAPSPLALYKFHLNSVFPTSASILQTNLIIPSNFYAQRSVAEQEQDPTNFLSNLDRDNHRHGPLLLQEIRRRRDTANLRTTSTTPRATANLPSPSRTCTQRGEEEDEGLREVDVCFSWRWGLRRQEAGRRIEGWCSRCYEMFLR